MFVKSTAVVGAALVAALFVAAPALAQKPVSESAAISESFTIEAINHTARVVTLKDKDGLLEDVYCGPDVQRFDALKVGDKVTFRYHESLVTAIKPSGGAAAAAAAAAVTRTPGTAPGGTIAAQLTVAVTIEAIDPKAPSITIKMADGRRSSFKVDNAKNLEGFKAGDTVNITYTRALAVSVTPAK